MSLPCFIMSFSIPILTAIHFKRTLSNKSETWVGTSPNRSIISDSNFSSSNSRNLDIDIEKMITEFKELAEYFRPMIIDTIAHLNEAILEGSKTILIEGANATMLDIDFGKFNSQI